MKRTVRVVVLLFLACAALASLSNVAQAQKIDLAFGVSTIEAPGASACGSSCGNPYFPETLAGGAYPGFSGDVLFWHNLGFGAEVSWRAAQRENFEQSGFNFRPVFYNFNAVYAAKVVPHVAVELVGGIGGSDTHVLACNALVFSSSSCVGGTSTIGSSNHFDADFGGGVKLYVHGGFFIRPEARFYIIHNETDYSANHATRVGASIGYTFR